MTHSQKHNPTLVKVSEESWKPVSLICFCKGTMSDKPLYLLYASMLIVCLCKGTVVDHMNNNM